MSDRLPATFQTFLGTGLLGYRILRQSAMKKSIKRSAHICRSIYSQNITFDSRHSLTPSTRFLWFRIHPGRIQGLEHRRQQHIRQAQNLLIYQKISSNSSSITSSTNENPSVPNTLTSIKTNTHFLLFIGFMAVILMCFAIVLLSLHLRTLYLSHPAGTTSISGTHITQSSSNSLFVST